MRSKGELWHIKKGKGLDYRLTDCFN